MAEIEKHLCGISSKLEVKLADCDLEKELCRLEESTG